MLIYTFLLATSMSSFNFFSLSLSHIKIHPHNRHHRSTVNLTSQMRHQQVAMTRLSKSVRNAIVKRISILQSSAQIAIKMAN